MDKAEADRHDKMLELAELLTEVLQKAVPSLNEAQGEELGIYMAKNRDVFAKAFKNQPDALSELSEPAAE
jgi:dsDNA-binding SOS-regulon protein